MNGLILVDKPKGFTSFDVVAKARGIFKQKKIGHAGTLDPNAEGVLLLFLGNATRCCDILPENDKVYRAEMQFGVETDTGDVWGKVLSTKNPCADEACILSAIRSFIGPYDQIPPMYSAKKVKGKKLYELARKGITVERKPVPLTIYDIYDIEIDMAGHRAAFTVHCEKGTYIRTLVTDIAASLNEKAAMSRLVRLKHGPFSLRDAHRPEVLEEAAKNGDAARFLLPTDSVFASYGKCVVKPGFEPFVKNGNPLSDAMTELEDGDQTFFRVYLPDGSFVALYQKTETGLKPYKMFLS